MITDQERPKIVIHCPACAAEGRGQALLVIRKNRENGSQFLGCSNYPMCRHTQELPEHVAMEAAGAQRLPGF